MAASASGRFSDLLHGLTGPEVTLGQLIGALNERGHALLVLLFVVPFLQPLPLPGVSTVLGAVVAVVGLQMALGRPPWLPQRLRRHALARSTLERLTHAADRFLKRFEKI